MQRKSSAWMPIVVIGSSILLGGWFLQEGADRDQNVYSQLRLVQEVIDYVSQEYVESVDESELYESAIDGVLEQLGDPNSSFIAREEWEDFAIRTTEGQYGGVGLEVLERDGYVTVISPMPGGPGLRAGIRSGDQFYEIDGQLAQGWEVDRAVDALRGPAGESVEVKMLRQGVEEPISFTLTREVIRVRSVPFTLTLDDGIGYVPLQRFNNTSTEELRRAIDGLVADGIRSLILDVRGNPGGLLEEGIGISDLFLDQGDVIVETRGRGRGQTQTYSASTADAYPDLPLVILVDERSASASEIVAGALQDHDRAVVIGAPTFGKGSVQTLYRVALGGVLRLTTAKWYTSVGRSINKELEAGDVLPRGAVSLEGPPVLIEDLSERPTFESMSGRTLLGGGGIVPDRWILADTLSTAETRAVNRLSRQAGIFTSGVFNYAVRYVQENPDLDRDFRITDRMMADLQLFLIERGMDFDPADYAGAGRFIRTRLEQEIALQAFGEQGEAEHMMRYDPQMEEALRILRMAESTEDLFRLAGVENGVDPSQAPAPIDRQRP